MATNREGLECEGLLKELLPAMGISHRWADDFEDEVLGVDCWLGLELDPVDFTIISPESSLACEKFAKAMKRGVVPVFLERVLILRAYYKNSYPALMELRQEIQVQVPLKLKMLPGNRMTWERAAQIKAAWKRQPAAVA